MFLVTAVIAGTAGGFVAWVIFHAAKDLGWI